MRRPASRGGRGIPVRRVESAQAPRIAGCDPTHLRAALRRHPRKSREWTRFLPLSTQFESSDATSANDAAAKDGGTEPRFSLRPPRTLGDLSGLGFTAESAEK